MKALKNKYPNINIFLCLSALMLAFWIFCTKLIIKMDDGHFMGILANEGFSLTEWLKLRYETLSGRTTGEALMMTLLKANPILWKLFGFALCEYTVYFIYKISLSFGSNQLSKELSVLSGCSVFLIFVGVLNAGLFWFAGSFTFFVPCAFMFITLTPAIFDVLGISCSPVIRALAFPCAVLAASQEQAAVCTCAMLLILCVISVIIKKFRVTAFLPALISLAAMIYLLSSPGAKNRGLIQAEESFEAFLSFGIFKKLLLGFTNYCSYTFYISYFTAAMFTALLCTAVYGLYKDNKKAKRLVFIPPAYLIFVTAIYNGLHFVFAKESIDANIKHSFTDNEINLWIYLTAIVCGIMILFWAAMIILLLKKNPAAGIATGIICCAAAGCGLMIGFSSSVFASGKRVFFYSEILMIIACIILFACIKQAKASKVFFRILVAAAGVFYIFNAVNLMFIELPVMN